MHTELTVRIGAGGVQRAVDREEEGERVAARRRIDAHVDASQALNHRRLGDEITESIAEATRAVQVPPERVRVSRVGDEDAVSRTDRERSHLRVDEGALWRLYAERTRAPHRPNRVQRVHRTVVVQTNLFYHTITYPSGNRFDAFVPRRVVVKVKSTRGPVHQRDQHDVSPARHRRRRRVDQSRIKETIVVRSAESRDAPERANAATRDVDKSGEAPTVNEWEE